ncbi:MAG: ATP-binding protein [Bacteroidetes bacterium]|nr:ATP-binding protein [Bacteroidota bacterium]MDA0888722.1 ATP-binding protein [Bacteroidota bacterium]MDA1084279.1 ATP-binding protein [Bacteroidota bacterium]
MKNPRKVYRFSLTLSLLITIFVILINALLLFFYTDENPFSKTNIIPLGLSVIFIFSVCFIVFNFRIENYIYKQIKQFYKDLEPNFGGEMNDILITNDVDSLLNNVKQIALNRSVEIDSLKDQAAFRREFLGNIAHELKTPLFTVQGYILTLLDGAMNDKNVNRKYLLRASKGVERLTFIVKDLDLLTSLEKGNTELDFYYFDIIDLIQSVFDMLEMEASKSSINLEFDKRYEDPITVYADRERVQQVLTNLIMNSIKYGKIKGTTEVSIQPIYENKVIIRIRDNGEGIEEVHLPRLFERFYRVDKSGNRKMGGSGLGLAIVKHIIEAHGEQIFLESQPEIGSEFSFTLDKGEATA